MKHRADVKTAAGEVDDDSFTNHNNSSSGGGGGGTTTLLGGKGALRSACRFSSLVRLVLVLSIFALFGIACTTMLPTAPPSTPSVAPLHTPPPPAPPVRRSERPTAAGGPRGNAPHVPVLPVLQLVEPEDAKFHGLDESVMPPIVIQRSDQVCAMCTDGLVYVHLGRPAQKGEVVTSQPQTFTAREEMYVQPATAPVFSATTGTAAEVVSRCLAQLMSLGMIGISVNASMKFESPDPVVTASVVVDFDTASPHASIGVEGRCPAFFNEVRPVTDGGTVKMDASYPRLPSWPLPSALYPTAQGGNNNTNAGVRGPLLPPYFGTAAVRETDVDKDVLPPLSVTLAQDRQSIRIRFGEDATSTRPEAFEMTCSSYFMSVMVGCFGRHNNQLQEMMNTLAFAQRVNRTFIVPVFLPENYVHYLRVDAEKFYGFNALRREGGYCLVNYAEARAILKELEAHGEKMSLRRFNYFGHFRPLDEREWKSINEIQWWIIPTPSPDGVLRYNVDGWLQDARAQDPPVTTVRDDRADGMFFYEKEKVFTTIEFFPNKDERKFNRMAGMRKALKTMIGLLGGHHADDGRGEPQARLAVMSSRMGFFSRSSIMKNTRAMALLRPSPSVNAEIDRFYAANVARVHWPVGTNNATGTGFHDTLRPVNFKNVMGLHVRRREGTCRSEAIVIDRTNYALDPRFRLQPTDPSWSGPISTLRHIELDCALTKSRLTEIYRYFTKWMRHNMTADPAVAETLVPTIYMAYDDQYGPINDIVDKRLTQLSVHRLRTEVWGNASLDFPPHFVAAYDRRIKGSFGHFHAIEHNKQYRRRLSHPRKMSAEQQAMVDMTYALYNISHQEIFAMVVDYFMLTNVAVFRGGMISSITTNVLMRRWGRGLPGHAALPGYAQSFFAPMWFDA